jgi:pSer/pThr/pTyr-binding forkhead associated (FHA) protein
MLVWLQEGRQKQRGKNAESPRLVAIGVSGPREHRLLKRKITVGNYIENDVVVPDPTVSRRHAILKRHFRRYRLIDLESTNGTFINGRRIRTPTPIARGDELRFGAARFVLLQSPATHELRKRVSFKTAFPLMVLIFALGFATTQHFINLSLSKRLSVASTGKSATLAKLEEEREETKANLAKAREEAEQPAWLRRVNYYRGLARLSPVTEDSALSHADFLHTRYLVKYQLRTHSEHFAHSEDASDPYYTPEGLAAAKNSDMEGPGNMPESGESAVDGWIRGAFHRLAILDPDVRKAGFGGYTEAGLEALALYMPSEPTSPRPANVPIEFPPANSVIPLAVYEGQESPDPLESCAGYVATGLPITLQLGAWIPVEVTGHSFTHDGIALEHCVFDATTYTNPNEATQSWARQGLNGSSAVVLIPRTPLTSGERYSVSVTAAGRNYAWSFAVGD